MKIKRVYPLILIFNWFCTWPLPCSDSPQPLNSLSTYHSIKYLTLCKPSCFYIALAMGSDGGRHWGVAKVVQTGMGCFKFSISAGTSDRPLLDPLPPPHASPMAFPFLNSIAVPQYNGMDNFNKPILLTDN